MTPNDVKIIADNIDDFIENPDGLTRLRKAVLTLAVSGKLVPQVKAEDSAKELYKKIQLEHAKELGMKRKRKEIATDPIQKEAPFTVPKSWMWVRGSDLFSVVRGVTYGKQDASDDGSSGYIPLLRSHNIQEIGLNTNKLVFVRKEKVSAYQILKRGDILIAMSSGSKSLVGKAAQVADDMEYSYGAFCAAIRSKYSSIVPYLGFFFSTPYYRNATALAGKGMSINNLTVGTLEDILIPLPPLMEQGRIVKKAQVVIAQLDELEAKKRERDEVRARLARSAMQSLGKGDTKIAFEQLSELVKTPADLKELENGLLALAVSGKLVPQDKKDGTGEELYSQIQKEQGRSNGGRRKSRVFELVTEEETPYEIPTSWKWIRFGSVFTDYGSGSTPSRGNDDFYKNGKTNWYKSGELNDGILSADSEEKISGSALEKCHLRLNKRGDLLIAMYGATAGRIAMLENEGATNQAVWGGTPKSGINLKYAFLYMLQSRDRLLETSSGAAQPNISGEKISAHLLPLPPVAEQKRIVKKVEEVMSLINHLKQAVNS